MRQKVKGWILRKEFSYSTGKIRYDVEGDGPPLVLVHGTPWSSFNWRHITPALAQWWTVYLLLIRTRFFKSGLSGNMNCVSVSAEAQHMETSN
jgi:hypothetical protein